VNFEHLNVFYELSRSYLWSNWSLVLTNQIGLVAVQETKPALAAATMWTNGVSGAVKFSLQKFLTVEYVQK